MLCRDLPNSFIYFAHVLILNQYFEFAFIFDILVDLNQTWQDASNKLVSRRQFLNATMIIVLAFIIAHFFDKSFYTFKASSDRVDSTVAVFALLMRLYIFVLSGYVFFKVIRVTRRERLLQLNKKILVVHICVLSCLLAFEMIYEISDLSVFHDNVTGEGESS